MSLNINFVGDAGVGKTSIIRNFQDESFVSEYKPTVGVGINHRKLVLSGESVKLQMNEVAGNSGLNLSGFFRRANGVVIVYDTTDMESFNNVAKWLETIKDSAPADANKIILGTKCDIVDSKERVDSKMAKDLADAYGIKLVEVSAKESKNIDTTLTEFISQVSERVGPLEEERPMLMK